MKKNNPMKNKEIALKNGKKHMRAVIIDGIEYEGVIVAAKALNVRDVTITSWCQRGYNPQGVICRYKDELDKKFEPRVRKNLKPVLIDGKDYYPSVKEAALALGAKDSSPLCKALKNNTMYKGHKCEYANQQPS